MNTGAAGLSFVLVLNAGASFESSGDAALTRARFVARVVLLRPWVSVGPGGVRGSLELGSGDVVSPRLLPLMLFHRAPFIIYVVKNSGGPRIRQRIK